MNWNTTRLAVVLSAFTMMHMAHLAGAQMMGYGPAGMPPGYGAVQPPYAMQPGAAGPQMAGPQMHVQWGTVPGNGAQAQAVVPAGVNAGVCGGGGADGCGSCGNNGCGGGCGSGCDDGGCGFLSGGLLGLGNRCFSLGGNCGCDVCSRCTGIGCGMGCGGLFGNHGPWPGGDGQFCYPRWWDVSVESIWLKRENLPSNQIMSSYGVMLVPNAVQTAMTTDDLGRFDFRPGFRLTAAKLIGPGTNVEVGYFGAMNWSSSASVRQNNNLYSALSDFGGQNLPEGFRETDAADVHRIAYSSDLNSLEVNMRRRFVSPDCWLHTSALMGIRYVRIEEDFRYRTRVRRLDDFFTPPARILAGMDYVTKTKNDLVGYQLGGDFWACVLPSWKFGGDLKAGIFGNHARQKTSIDTGGIPVLEADGVTSASFVGEANLWLVYHITSRTTLRGGYQFLYVSSVALATDNFNSGSPALLNPNAGGNPATITGRTLDIDSDGFAFYHGFNFGFEWTW